ncbi:hypothetical protein BCT21_04880 [Vibrio sp. 10N.222.55.F9]|uniref:O-antigen polymerase n=1 Tax=Vibrio sp. 10N.222.55.F9 TaxID=1884471 RepID=UPI000C83E5DC|nr:O-antigen polymerase [Vibrio sp. 10N.222.55.F9]PMO06765.1 hypothetical protein BCT21_04880 [Vibrio sp. 10N.222.55.F9]
MISILIFIFLFLSLIIHFKLFSKLSVLSVGNVYLLSIILCSFLPILYISVNDGFLRIDNGVAYTDSSYFYYLFYVSLTIIFCYPMLLYLSRYKDPIKEVMGSDIEILSSKVENLIIIVSAIFSIPFVIFVLSLINDYGINVYLANRIILLQGNGYIISLVKLPQIAVGIIFFNQMLKSVRYGIKIQWIKVLLLVLYSFFLAGIVGSRTQMLIPVVSILVIYLIIKFSGSINIKGIKKVAILSFMVVFIAVSFGEIRQSIMADKEITISSNSSMFSKLAYTYGSVENLIWLFDHNEPKEFAYGATFFAALTGFVPRAFWHDKPLGGGPMMKNLISTGSYDLDSGENISSVTTGIVAESYLNFSWFGVLFPALFLFFVVLFFDFFKVLHPANYISLYSYLIFKVFGLSSAEFFGIMAHVFVFVFSAVIFELILRGSSGKIILHR